MPNWSPRPTPVGLTAVFCAVAIAACGSSGHAGGSELSGGPLLTYAQCMRWHGVLSFPDPKPTGGLVIPNSIDSQAPAFLSAQRACAQLAQAGGSRRTSPESRRAQLLALARCMRSHGVPDFADPTNSPPPATGGNAIGSDGAYLALGTPEETRSPAYRQAADACRLGLP